MKRVNTIMDNPLFIECLDKNLSVKHFDRDCRHDLQHMIDVARITYILVLESGEFRRFISENQLASPHAAKEVIYAAGILHDIARWHEYETNEDHAVYGAELAGSILSDAGFDDNEAGLVQRAIYEHRALENETSFLGEKLYRADNLSRNCRHCPAWHRCSKAVDDIYKYMLVY